MNIHWLQHVPFEGLGTIADWARTHSHSLRCTRLWAGDPLPSLKEFDWLVIMGGPMSIYDDDQYPWLAAEREFIRAAISSGKTMLGICLGAQLIADALGVRVVKNEHSEIGWWPIHKSPAAAESAIGRSLPDQINAFHWHGDTFATPTDAVHLFSSAGCANQAFVYDERVVGLQFHLETTPESADRLIQHCGNEITDGPYVQKTDEIRGERDQFAVINRVMSSLLSRLAEGPPSGSSTASA